MLTEFESFRVPGAAPIEVYRNALDPQAFHLLPDNPRLAIDEKSALPLFNFALYSRNIEIAYASAVDGQPVETQLGGLQLTCDLSVPDHQWETIRLYLVDLLRREMVQPSTYNKLFKVATTSDEPLMSYANTWTQGTVRMDLLEQMGPTFKRASSEAQAPELRGTMMASLWANFGTEGAQLMWEALHPHVNGNSGNGTLDIPLSANIRYDLVGVSRAPALQVFITAKGGPLYNELRQRTEVNEHVGNQSWTYPQLSSLVKELVDKRVLTIDWRDFGIPDSDPAAADIKKQLQSTVLGMITNKIADSFFRDFAAPGLKDEDLGKTFTHTRDGGVPGSRLWLNDYHENNVIDFEFNLDYSANYTFKASPQTSVLSLMTPEQRDKLVRIIDVGSPEVRVLEVPIYTNAAFAEDNIANITTTLSYKQFDHMTDEWIERTEPFVFKTGDETFIFRTRLARDAEGRLIDRYDAKAQVNYRGISQPPSPIEQHDISERALTFSYDRLGYVNVTVQAGDIDWKEIANVYVDFEYESASSQPDARGTVELRPDKLEDRWTTSKHGQTSNAYRYTVHYVFVNGDEVHEDSVRDERGTLVVHDTLSGRLRKTFDVALDPQTVDSVTLAVRYQRPDGDAEETRNTFTATGSWEYVRTLTDGASQELEYTYSVQYKDGFTDPDKPWAPLAADEDPPALTARRYRVPITIDGEGVSWDTWRTVYLTVTYRAEDHEYERVEELRISKDEPRQTIEMLAFSPRARSYDYAATFVPRDPEAEGVQVPATEDEPMPTHSGPLLLETLV